MLLRSKKILSLPGVYIFKDRQKKPLYVGKAKNLKKRIQQYFRSHSLKIKKLLSLAQDIEVIYTSTEIEALLKESNLIKKLNPPFNHLLKDDSQYFYLGFTKDLFPKVIITHQPEKYDFREVIGPFSEGVSLKNILKIVRSSIPFCTCRENHLRKCLNAEIGLCFGFCCLKNGEIKKEDIKKYLRNLELIKQILSGNLVSLRKKILMHMKTSLEKENLNKAIELKKIYESIKKIESSQEIIREKDSYLLENEKRKILISIKKIFNLNKLPQRIEVIDISHFAGKEKIGVIVTFIEGEYVPGLLKVFNIRKVIKPDDPRMIYEVLNRRLKHLEWGLPDLFLIDGGKIQFKFAYQAIEEKKVGVKILALAKPQKKIYYDENNYIFLEEYPLIKDFFLALDQKAHHAVINRLRKKINSRFNR